MQPKYESKLHATWTDKALCMRQRQKFLQKHKMQRQNLTPTDT